MTADDGPRRRTTDILAGASTEEGFRHVVHLRGDGASLGGFGQGDGDDLIGAQGDAGSESPGEDEIDGGDAEARAENAVESGGGAAALDVAEDGDARVVAGSLLDLAGENLPDAADAGTPNSSVGTL